MKTRPVTIICSALIGLQRCLRTPSLNRKPLKHAKTNGERARLKIRRRASRKKLTSPNVARAALSHSLPLRSLLLLPNQLRLLQQLRRQPHRQPRLPQPNRLQPRLPPPREPTNSRPKHWRKLAALPIPSCGST